MRTSIRNAALKYFAYRTLITPWNNQTRMHSSRMRTARSLPYGGSLIETPLNRDLLDIDPPGHVNCGTCWNRDPPVTRITDRCKNITLRNFVTGGNDISSKYPVTKRVSSNTRRRFWNVFSHGRRCWAERLRFSAFTYPLWPLLGCVWRQVRPILKR